MTEASKFQAKEVVKTTNSYKTKASDKVVSKTISTENVFAKILGDEKMDRKQKAQAIGKAFAVDDTKDAKQQAERREEFILMREFVLEELKNQSLNTLDASNRTLTARLQQYVKNFNSNFIDFRKKIDPVLKIVKSVGVLTSNNITAKVYEEIENYKKLEDERKAKLEEKSQEIKKAEDDKQELQNKQNALEKRNRIIQTEKIDPKTDDKFRNLLGLKSMYKNEIKLNQEEIARITAAIPTIAQKVEALNVEAQAFQTPTPKTSEFDDAAILAAKDGLEEMLNLSADELKGQVDDLITSSTTYITDADSDLKTLNGDYGSYKSDLDNTHLKIDGAEMTLSILNAGLIASKEIDVGNAKKYGAPVLPEGQEEDPIDKTERIKKKALFDDQNKNLIQIASDNGLITTDIQQQRVTVTNMIDTTASAMANARRLKSQGISQLAAGAVTTVQALNNAAIDQSTKAAEESLDDIRNEMTGIMNQEVIREANGGKEISQRLQKAFSESSDLGRLVEDAMAVKAEGTKEVLESLSNLEGLNKTLRDTITDYSGVTSKVTEEFNEQAAANQNEQTATTDNSSVKKTNKSKGVDITKI